MKLPGENDSGFYLIAEIGSNHDGDPEKAHRLIDLMADAGAHAVKFQTYTPRTLLADTGRMVEWGPVGNRTREKAGDMFSRISLPRQAHGELFAHARERGVEPFSTIFDPEDLDFLLGLGQRLFKISSGDINYKRLLEKVAACGRPVLISAGKSTLDEAERALRVLQNGAGPVCLMHCLAAYPAPYAEVNLKTLEFYRQRFPEVRLGFSDHTLGITCALGAICLGASVIEKHVTYDKKAWGPDHWFSADPAEFRFLADEVRHLEHALGTCEKRIQPSEISAVLLTRRSIIAKSDLPAGHVLSREDILFLRPGSGIDPFDEEKIIGKKLRRKVEKDQPLQWADF